MEKLPGLACLFHNGFLVCFSQLYGILILDPYGIPFERASLILTLVVFGLFLFYFCLNQSDHTVMPVHSAVRFK